MSICKRLGIKNIFGMVGAVVLVTLVGCGGGGGSAGTPSGAAPAAVVAAPLFTSAPDVLTLGVGASQDFSIGGGVAPYTAVSNNAAVGISGVKDLRVTIGGISSGTAEITIRDSLGASVKISLIVSNGSVRALFTTSASDVVVAPGNANAQTYTVGGGAAPYSATSSNATVVSVSIVGDSLKVTGLTAGLANIVILDKLGARLTIAVTVPTVSNLALFTTAPPGVFVAVASAPSYSVGGGTGPYIATSSNTSIATVSLVGSNLTISGVTSGSANIVVRDSTGAVVTVAVTVANAPTQALFTTAPPAVRVAIGAAPDYSVGGGTGPYIATTSDASVATVSVVGSNLKISGVASGSANIVVRDNTGAVVTVAVTVSSASTLALFTTAPPAVTVAIGAAPGYSVGGGTGPYTATTSNASVATVSLSGSNLTISGLATGNANIVVRDSTGAVVTVAVTVPAAGTLALFTTAPSAVTIAIGAAPAYTVSGGTGPYTATSNNAGIATTSLAGSNLTITGVAVGSAIVSVRDSAGTVVNISVTIGTAPIGITPNNATGIIADRLVATITGGTAPFRASVGNLDVASASVSGNQLDITLKQVGTTVVTVLDANNQSIPYTLIVNAATPGIRLSPNPLTVSELDTQPIFLTVYGAAAGTLNVFSSDTSKLVATISGQTVTLITGTSGDRCVPGNAPGGDLNVTITVVDSTRASGSAVVTIRNSVTACP